MILISKQLGPLDYEDEQIITFKDGLLGFENLTQFLLVNFEETRPFEWLVSIEEPLVALPIVNPLLVDSEYKLALSKEEVEKGFAAYPESNSIYGIVNFTNEIPTVNLRGPLLINEHERLGKQIVLNDETYSFRHKIIANLLEEEEV